MEYNVNTLARLSGVSARTLRYYDEIGLLCPKRNSLNDYRIYGPEEVDLLQQILFYRQLGLPLEEIGKLLHSPDYDREKALAGHLENLLQKREQLDQLIQHVTKTLDAWKGEITMSDEEKFVCFRQRMLEENEAAYGEELRSQYGSDAVEQSNSKFRSMDRDQWEKAEQLRTEYEALLKSAAVQGDPASHAAQKVCDLHRQWLQKFWPEGTYSKNAHLGLGRMYLADPRFSAYYEKIVPGGAAFFAKALEIYCSE